MEMMKLRDVNSTLISSNYCSYGLKIIRVLLNGWKDHKISLQVQMCGLHIGREIVSQVSGK